jgi:hypothetical protein
MNNYLRQTLFEPFGLKKTGTTSVDSPMRMPPPTYGAAASMEEAPDTSDPLTPAQILLLQTYCGIILYYGRSIDNTVLCPLNKISKRIKNGTKDVQALMDHLIQYLLWHPQTTIVYYPSDMRLGIVSDASYLSEQEAHSRAGGDHRLGSDVTNNGIIDVLTTTIGPVCSSASEAEFGAGFLNARRSLATISALEFLGWKQQPVTIVMDNQVAWGIVNSTCKIKRSRAMSMRFYWLLDREAQQQFRFKWEPGATNLADYFTKIHPTSVYRERRSMYVTDE